VYTEQQPQQQQQEQPQETYSVSDSVPSFTLL